MKATYRLSAAILFAGFLAVGSSTNSFAETDSTTKRSVSVANGAVKFLNTQMNEIPSKRIPLYLRRLSKCIAVFPGVYKAGVIIAGQRGQGLVSCRNRETAKWGPPAYFNFSAASIGLQAGIQEASIVLLALTQNAIETFLNEDIGFSGNVTIAAGPVGGTATRTSLPSVASYVRTSGLFAGVDLGGSNITFAKKANTALYGNLATAESILFGNLPVPNELQAFHAELPKFAPLPDELRPEEGD